GEGEALLDAARTQGTKVISLPPGSLAALRSLVKTLRATPTALICTHGYKADILGIVAGGITGTPVASFLRGWTGEDAKVRAYEMLNRAMLRFSDGIVALSETQRAQLAAAGFRGKTQVVVNAVEAVGGDAALPRGELRKRLGLPADAVVVACAGRLSPEKGTKFFVRMAKGLAAEFPLVHFVVFGDGRLRKELEAESAGSTQLHFAGHVQDFRELVAGVDILVNPSLAEEMPNVVLEAMSAGVPVVATAVGGVPEIAASARVMEVVPPGDVEALTSATGTLLREPAAAKALGEAGRARVIERYSPAMQKEQLLKVMRPYLPSAANLTPLPETPFISIVIPVRNEELHLGNVLGQLDEQDYPADRYEVLVADGNSTDGTRRVVEEFARSARTSVQVIANPKQLSSAGRNVGALASRGEVIAFIDGHCQIPSRQLLGNIVELMRTQGAACLCRPQPLHVEGNTPFQSALAHTRATALGHGHDSTIFDMEQERFVDPTSSGAIYRAEVLARIGLYDESFDACEDVEFNFRVGAAGFTAFSSPRIAVHYSPRKDLSSLWKQLVRYGRGRHRFMRKHAQAITVAQLVPAAFVLWLAGLGVGGWFWPPAMWALAGTLLIYGSVTLAFAIRLSFRYGWRHLFFSPAVYACIHLGLGMGFWGEALWGRKPQPDAVVRDFQRTSLPPRTSQPGAAPGTELTSATSNKR
ncbi:MAG: glycosyltransferase, partial [Terriglobales bacterium]